MTQRSRNSHLPETKMDVAVAALAGKATVGELARTYGVHRNLVQRWRNQLATAAVGLFNSPGRQVSTGKVAEGEVAKLQMQIEALKKENDFLGHALSRSGWLGAGR